MLSFSALTLLVGSSDPQKIVPDMTYNVFGGTLNPTLLLLVTYFKEYLCRPVSKTMYMYKYQLNELVMH